MLSHQPSAEDVRNTTTASPQSNENSSPRGAGSAALKSDDGAITRISRACERCRRLKARCNGGQPCLGCSRQSTTCIYRTGRSRVRTRRNQQPQTPAQGGPVDPQTDHPVPVCAPEQQTPKPKVPGQWWYRRCCVGIRVRNPLTSSFQVYGPSSQIAFLQRVYERLAMCQFPGSEDREPEIPTAIRNWRLERFLFSMPRETVSQPSFGAFFPRSLGDLFIRSYFKLVHPQLPILDYQKVLSEWEASWKAHDVIDKQPEVSRQNKEVLFMALAIGARVCPTMNQDSFKLADTWAEHFSQRVEIPLSALEEPSLHLVRVFLLKAIYAQQVVRTNDAYMHLGYAARTTMALGINHSFDLEGNGADTLEISLIFWVTYIMERMTTLMIGRNSSLRDEYIDAWFPSDNFIPADPRQILPCGAITNWAYIRAMAMLAGLADEILMGIYNSKVALLDVQSFLPTNKILECEARLQDIVNSLPAHLNCLDAEAPVGEAWQEIQRLHFGVTLETMRMLTHRPALVFASFFPSVAEAQRNTSLQLGRSIELCVGSAKAIIRFTHHSLSSRVPDARSDGSPAIYLTSACLTLLFHVLDPDTTLESAKDTFLALDQAIQCLEDMKHAGPATGKRLSLDIMAMAQKVIFSPTGQAFMSEDRSLTAEYPWLDALNPGSFDTTSAALSVHEDIFWDLQAWPFDPPPEANEQEAPNGTW